MNTNLWSSIHFPNCLIFPFAVQIYYYCTLCWILNSRSIHEGDAWSEIHFECEVQNLPTLVRIGLTNLRRALSPPPSSYTSEQRDRRRRASIQPNFRFSLLFGLVWLLYTKQAQYNESCEPQRYTDLAMWKVINFCCLRLALKCSKRQKNA